MYNVVVKKFTFAISSPDQFLVNLLSVNIEHFFKNLEIFVGSFLLLSFED